MSRVIDQRLISSAMLAALAEHDGADTLKIFEMPIKVCISYTSKVGEVINDKDVIAELDNRFTIHNMPLAVFHKICGRMSKGKNKVLESLPNNTYRLIADLTTIEEEFRKQENLTNAEIMQIIEKLKKWLEEKVPRFNKDENYVSGIFDKFIKSRGIDILFETENLRADVVNTVGVENYQIGCFILHAKENDTLLFDRMTEIIKGVMIASIIYLGSNEDTKFVKKRRMREVDVYLDTTLLLYALNYKTREQKQVADTLLNLLHANGARLHVFREHYNEVTDILKNFRDRDAYSFNLSQTLERLEEDKISSVEVDMEINELSYNLNKLGIDTVDTEEYQEKSSYGNEDEFIDYKGLKECIVKEIPSYSRSQRMLTNDVDAIASICLKRHGIRFESIESCKAIFVTTNNKLAKKSNMFLRYNQYQLYIPPTMGIMDITTLLWVKYGFSNPDLPMRQLVAIANAAVSPSKAVMQTFFEVTGRLVHRGDISEDEAADMRYSAYARAEIMHISGGNPSKLDDTTVLNVHNRVKENYAQEENIRAKKAEKQLEEANVRTNKALEIVDTYKSGIVSSIADVRKEAKKNAEHIAGKSAKYLSLAIRGMVVLFMIISTVLVVYYGLNESKGFVALAVAMISGVSTITLWIPAFKTYSKINQYIYGWIEPRIYEKNLNKRQGEIDRLQNMLNSNGSNLL